MGLPGYTQCSMRCGSVGGLAGAATKRRAKGPHRDLPAWGKRGAGQRYRQLVRRGHPEVL